MRQITLILDDIRSAHNVGAIMRNAAAFGVENLLCCGITPYPKLENDSRLPHVAQRATRQIEKTALGATAHVSVAHYPSVEAAVVSLNTPHTIYALELTDSAQDLTKVTPSHPCAIILGNEVDGIAKTHLGLADKIVQIPSHAQKRSLNVASASAIALYHFST